VQRPVLRPLDGLRVADFSRVLAGPFAARVMADLGAEVIKIEAPDGDLARRLGPRHGGMSGYFMQQNCGKRNLSLDLKTAAGRDIAIELVARSDVLIENFLPGVMDAFGLAPAVLRARHPGLVYCSISGFGHDSPWRDRRAFAGIAHASTGMLYRQAQAWGTEPRDSVLAVGDTVTGLQAVIAILAALRLREKTGRGQFIDMAMHDALLSVQEAANFYLFPDGGTEHDFLCSWMFRCGDEYLVMPSDPRAHWVEIVSALGRADLAAMPEYATYELRVSRLDELEALIQDCILDQPSAETVVAALHAHGLPGARVSRLSEALESEQTRARRMTVEVDDNTGRRVRVLNSPYRFSDAEAGVGGKPAFRGEHNTDVLRDVLGLRDDAIRALEHDGVVSSRPPTNRPKR
jgi:crotonobetainyl-CoA:carnitine CoA-transferase CaiB-like acyl-CoA transferase